MRLYLLKMMIKQFFSEKMNIRKEFVLLERHLKKSFLALNLVFISVAEVVMFIWC